MYQKCYMNARHVKDIINLLISLSFCEEKDSSAILPTYLRAINTSSHTSRNTKVRQVWDIHIGTPNTAP